MERIRILFAGISVAIVVALAACSAAPPLSDNLTLVPVSDKADAAAGLDMTYVYGVNQGFFNHVSCDREQNCWYSGHLGFVKGGDTRINPLVVRTTADGAISWARSYQFDGQDTETLGTLPTQDGGALLYGNAIVSERGLSRGPLRPLYEKLDTRGIPQWGGTMMLGQLQPWSAFSDAIRLANGGYALTGSGVIDGNWHGAILSLDASGNTKWAVVFKSREDSTLSYYLTQLGNGHILAVGYNAEVHDIVLFDFAPNGRLTRTPIFHIRGREIPVGFVPLATGPAIIANQEMPSGEFAALVLRLSDDGAFENAIRYRYVDGFDPFDVIALPNHGMCLYGMTEAHDKRLSLAFTVDVGQKPRAALAIKGAGVFASGTRFSSDKLIFVGGRPLGVDKHITSVVTKWSPAAKNEEDILRGISEEPISVSIYKEQGAKEWNDEKGVVSQVPLSDFQTRLVSGEAARSPSGGGK